MDATLDEDFVNFEAFSQTCSSLATGTDEEIRLLDNEARQRDRKVQGGKKSEEAEEEMKPPSQSPEEGSLSSEYHLFTTFSYNSASKKLTMIPVKYKIKEERRKVLKISVNKLKKIDDPESWLCRSVLINNTMKKLQKETRDEKVNKQMTYSKNYLPKTTDEFGCQNNNNNDDSNKNENNNNPSSNNNNNNNNNINNINKNNVDEKVYRVEVNEDRGCFYQKDLEGELVSFKSEEFLFQVDKPREEKPVEKESSQVTEEDSAEDKCNSSLSEGVPINEDFVEKIPSIKRCASRKKSVDEDGTPTEILNLNEGKAGSGEMEEVDECDVHDVLSQLYMPPTPRMLTSIDGDADDDDLNVVDIDASYIDGIKSECSKLPGEGLFGSGLLAGDGGKKDREEDDAEGNPAKRRKLEDVFSWESYDNFLCGSRTEESERTSGGGDACKDSGRTQEEEPVIELEDEEDIKRRLSQSLSSHYHRKPEKTCDAFFDETCDNQYSCGHTVTMFGDMQSVTFHNLIASLET